MKRYVGRILIFVILCALFLYLGNALADTPLDEIEKYSIHINVREDGTLDMMYEINWKVLSDKNGKEPLTWVIVGIPNSHVDQIQGLTDNIKTIKYSNDNGGDYVRIDFTEAYKKDAEVYFAFSIHQSYMYLLDEEDVCRYGFTPGWFDKIEIKELNISWSNKYVVSSDCTHKTEDELQWYRTDMKAGEHFKINVRYHRSTFSVEEGKQYEESSGLSTETIVFIVFIAIIVLVIVIVMIAEYYDGGGFGGGYFHSSCASSGGCACASSCACACACAGGGRAGCSAKNFYNTEHLEEVCCRDPWYVRIFKGRKN